MMQFHTSMVKIQGEGVKPIINPKINRVIMKNIYSKKEDNNPYKDSRLTSFEDDS